MNAREQDAAARQYFAERYEVVARHPLVAPRQIRLPCDDPRRRRCRFCGRGTSEARFKNDAHAVSNLLGNKSLFSLNECNDCNKSLGKYEDQLGKWSSPITSGSRSVGSRVLTRIPQRSPIAVRFVVVGVFVITVLGVFAERRRSHNAVALPEGAAPDVQLIPDGAEE